MLLFDFRVACGSFCSDGIFCIVGACFGSVLRGGTRVHCQCGCERAVGEDPVARCARPAPPTTPSNPAPRRPHQPPTRIQEMATAASSHSAAPGGASVLSAVSIAVVSRRGRPDPQANSVHRRQRHGGRMIDRSPRTQGGRSAPAHGVASRKSVGHLPVTIRFPLPPKVYYRAGALPL
jgi:hypothetical protein